MMREDVSNRVHHLQLYLSGDLISPRVVRFAQGVCDGDVFADYCGNNYRVWFAFLAQSISQRFQYRIVKGGHQRSLEHHVPQQTFQLVNFLQIDNSRINSIWRSTVTGR